MTTEPLNPVILSRRPKSAGFFLAGEEGLEPSSHGFGGRQSAVEILAR